VRISVAVVDPDIQITSGHNQSPFPSVTITPVPPQNTAIGLGAMDLSHLVCVLLQFRPVQVQFANCVVDFYSVKLQKKNDYD